MRPPRLQSRWQTTINDHVISLAWSPLQNRIAAAAIGGPIFLLNPLNGEVVRELPGHGFGTAAVAWHPDSKLLASCGQDGKAKLWDAESGALLHELAAGAAWVERIAWNPKGDRLVTAAGRKIKLWDAEGKLLQDFADSPSAVADIAWQAKGREFATAAYGGVTFRSPEAKEPLRHFPWQGSVLALAMSPDQTMLAGGGQDASIHFWYLADGKDLEMSGYPMKVRELAWDPKSRYLASGGGEVIMVWDCSGDGPAGSEPIALQFHEAPLTVLAYQSRGPVLASGCAAGKLALWSPGTAKRNLANAQLPAGVTQLRWAKSDEKLLVGCEDGTVAMFLT